MFGLSFTEILLLAGIGLIVLGPEQLQQVARVLGKTIGELKKAMHEVQSSVRLDMQEEEYKKQLRRDNPNAHPPASGASNTQAQAGTSGASSSVASTAMTSEKKNDS